MVGWTIQPSFFGGGANILFKETFQQSNRLAKAAVVPGHYDIFHSAVKCVLLVRVVGFPDYLASQRPKFNISSVSPYHIGKTTFCGSAVGWAPWHTHIHTHTS